MCFSPEDLQSTKGSWAPAQAQENSQVGCLRATARRGGLSSERGVRLASGQHPQVLGFWSLGAKGRQWPSSGSGRTPKAHRPFTGQAVGFFPSSACWLELAGRRRCSKPWPQSIPGHPLRSILTWFCHAGPVLALSALVGAVEPSHVHSVFDSSLRSA